MSLGNSYYIDEEKLRKDEEDYIQQGKELVRKSEELQIPLKGKYIRKKASKKTLERVKSRDTSYISFYQVELLSLFDDAAKSEAHKIGKWELAFLTRFIGYLEFPSNRLIIDGFFPSVEELCSLMGCKENKLYEILRNLEYFEIIKKQKSGRQSLIYFNPYIISTGISVNKATCEMFKGTMFNRFEE